jgi:rhodanese-related sulfurtransferase
MNRKKILLIAAASVFALVVASLAIYTVSRATNQAEGDASTRMLSPQQVNERLSDDSLFVVNVHTPYDGEIEGTDAFIAYDTITSSLAQLPEDKSTEILVYCRTGRMSAIAFQELTELGYTNVFDLTGGMEAWQAGGYEILFSPR